MRGCTTLLMALLLVFSATGCGHDESPRAQESSATSQTALPDVVARAATIAKEIEADPEAAEEVLARHGLSVEQFEDMIFEISSDPELSRAYNAALE